MNRYFIQMMGLNTNNYRNARTLLSEHMSSLFSSMQPQKSLCLYGSTVRPWNSVPKHDLQFKPFRPISHTLVNTLIRYSVTLLLFLFKKNHQIQILNGLLRIKIHRNMFLSLMIRNQNLKRILSQKCMPLKSSFKFYKILL